MDSVIVKAFAAFEGQRLAELLAEGIEDEEAQAVVLQQWEGMDEDARICWAPEDPAALPTTPTPSRARKRPAPPVQLAQANRSKAIKMEPVRKHVAPPPHPAGPAGEWICPAMLLEPVEDLESDAEELQEDEAETERKQHAFRTSQVVRVGGKHPDWLTEPAAVAEISLPRLPAEELVYLPRLVVEQGRLSSPQMESVAYAARRFRAYLPSGARAGYYLGDGTGCGKGRIIAALIWHLWHSGSKRHVWLSGRLSFNFCTFA